MYAHLCFLLIIIANVILMSSPICFCQVRLCNNAALPEQDQCYEAVGAAMDKELSVWRPLEEDP